MCIRDRRIAGEQAGLDTAGKAGALHHHRRGAIGAETVDDGLVALPQKLAQREGGTHEQDVVQLVEEPLVVHKGVKRLDDPHKGGGESRIDEIGVDLSLIHI